VKLLSNQWLKKLKLLPNHWLKAGEEEAPAVQKVSKAGTFLHDAIKVAKVVGTVAEVGAAIAVI